jgi:hypothetical protein
MPSPKRNDTILMPRLSCDKLTFKDKIEGLYKQTSENSPKHPIRKKNAVNGAMTGENPTYQYLKRVQNIQKEH